MAARTTSVVWLIVVVCFVRPRRALPIEGLDYEEEITKVCDPDLAIRRLSEETRSIYDMGYIVSPNFPLAPPSALECQWTFFGFGYVAVSITEFNLRGRPPHCNPDLGTDYFFMRGFTREDIIICGRYEELAEEYKGTMFGESDKGMVKYKSAKGLYTEYDDRNLGFVVVYQYIDVRDVILGEWLPDNTTSNHSTYFKWSKNVDPTSWGQEFYIWRPDTEHVKNYFLVGNHRTNGLMTIQIDVTLPEGETNCSATTVYVKDWCKRSYIPLNTSECEYYNSSTAIYFHEMPVQQHCPLGFRILRANFVIMKIKTYFHSYYLLHRDHITIHNVSANKKTEHLTSFRRYDLQCGKQTIDRHGPEPYTIIDLAGMYEVHYVELLTPDNFRADAVHDTNIYVYEERYGKYSVPSTASLCARHLAIQEWGSTMRVYCTSPTLGRYVHVTVATMQDWSNLGDYCDITVYGRRNEINAFEDAALLKPTFMDRASSSNPPHLAVRGHRDSNPAHCAQSLPLRRPGRIYWHVSLGAVYLVYSVTITSPDEPTPGEAGHFYIRVAMRGRLKWWIERYKTCYSGEWQYHPVTKEYLCQDAPLQGRFVVVYSRRTQKFILCAVEVLGIRTNARVTITRETGQNKPAQQSSTEGEMVASRAVDRNMTINNNTCMMTAPADASPWWYVDLLAVHEITGIFVMLTNESIAQNFTVFVFAGEKGDPLPDDAKLCAHLGKANYGQLNHIGCPYVLIGRFVRLQQSNHPLRFCEVQVVTVNKNCSQTYRFGGYELTAWYSYRYAVGLHYPPLVSCSHTIIEQNRVGDRKFLQIVISQLNLEYSEHCVRDFLRIGALRFCGKDKLYYTFFEPHFSQLRNVEGAQFANVALHRPVEITATNSTYKEQAKRVNDGDFYTCFTTEEGPQDHAIQIDLGEERVIYSVQVRFSIKEVPAAGNWWIEFHIFPLSVTSEAPGLVYCKSRSDMPEASSGSTLMIDCDNAPRLVRFVRLRAAKSPPLSVCEIGAFINIAEPFRHFENVARYKPAYQAQSYSESGILYEASLAVDGRTGKFHEGWCASALVSWWALDILDRSLIAYFLITRPTDDKDVLEQLEIHIFDLFWEHQICYKGRWITPANHVVRIPCSRFLPGRFIVIHNRDGHGNEKSSLTMCEVEVIARPLHLRQNNVALHKNSSRDPGRDLPARYTLDTTAIVDGVGMPENYTYEETFDVWPFSRFCLTIAKYWLVDLGTLFYVNAVELIMGFHYRQTLDILVYREYPEGQSKYGMLCFNHIGYLFDRATKVMNCTETLIGRYVKVRRGGFVPRWVYYDNFPKFVLCEVKVLGVPLSEKMYTNVALFKPTFMSPNPDMNSRYGSSLAVDGVRYSNMSKEKDFLTCNPVVIKHSPLNPWEYPWLMVDLGSLYRIHDVIVTTPCSNDTVPCKERPREKPGEKAFNLTMYKQNPRAADLDVKTDYSCGFLEGVNPDPKVDWAISLSVGCPQAASAPVVVARYVLLELVNAPEMKICELEVRGFAEGAADRWFNVPWTSLDMGFESDGDVTGRGFFVLYSLTDLKLMTVKECGGVLRKRLRQRIYSPGYFEGYYGEANDSYICQWDIPQYYDGITYVEVDALDLFQHPLFPETCFADMILLASDHNLEQVLCNNYTQLQKRIFVFSTQEYHSLHVTFMVRTMPGLSFDERPQHNGFALNIYTAAKCYLTFTEPYGFLASPGYPYQPYPSNFRCKWRIVLLKHDIFIRFHFKFLRLYPPVKNMYCERKPDVVGIFWDKDIFSYYNARFCGLGYGDENGTFFTLHLPSRIHGQEGFLPHSIRIEFLTDEKDNEAGFLLSFYEYFPNRTCGEMKNGSEYHNIGYPMETHFVAECIYTFTPPPHEQGIVAFQIESLRMYYTEDPFSGTPLRMARDWDYIEFRVQNPGRPDQWKRFTGVNYVPWVNFTIAKGGLATAKIHTHAVIVTYTSALWHFHFYFFAIEIVMNAEDFCLPNLDEFQVSASEVSERVYSIYTPTEEDMQDDRIKTEFVNCEWLVSGGRTIPGKPLEETWIQIEFLEMSLEPEPCHSDYVELAFANPKRYCGKTLSSRWFGKVKLPFSIVSSIDNLDPTKNFKLRVRSHPRQCSQHETICKAEKGMERSCCKRKPKPFSFEFFDPSLGLPEFEEAAPFTCCTKRGSRNNYLTCEYQAGCQ